MDPITLISLLYKITIFSPQLNTNVNINDINQKIIFLENNINNITNLSYNLEFALKRIEKHLELKLWSHLIQ